MKKIKKRKRIKGFTLIELLATIIILAVIIMIVIPIVLNVIAEARKGAFESSAYGILKTAENDCMVNLVKGDSKITEVFFEEGEITSEDILNFSGKVPEGGKVVINNNCKVQLAITDGFWCVQKAFNNKEVTVTRLNDIDGDCEITDFAGLIEWTLQENETLTATLPTVSGPNVEYSNDGINWQASSIFNDLEANAIYSFRIRIAGVETDEIIEVTSPRVYTILYQPAAGGNVTPLSKKVLEGGLVLGPDVIEYNGYDFTNFTVIEGAGNGNLNLANGTINNITGNMTVQVNFTIRQYTVNYQSNQGATFSPNFTTVNHGSDATTPNVEIEEGYTFSHYTAVSGVGNGNLNTETGNVTNVTGNMTIEASFVLNEYTVSYTAGTGGSVNTASRVVTHGGTSAAPGYGTNTGYTFSHYSVISGAGNGILESSTGEVTNVIGYITVRANFTINSYMVSYTAGTGGSVTLSSESVNWDSANSGTTANSNTGYSFTNFSIESGSCDGTFSSSTGICSSVREAITVRANFTINTYTVSYTAGTGGSVTVSSRTVSHGGDSAAPGHTANTGYHFVDFERTSGSGGSLNTTTGAVTNVTGNQTIRANFEINQYTVSYTAGTGGSVSPTSRVVDHGGTSAAVTPTATTGYSFANFTVISGAGNGTLNSSTGAVTNVTGAMTIQANFTLNSYTVSYTASTGGTVTVSSRTVSHGGTSDAPGHTANTGYHFVNYERTSGSGGSLNTSTGAVTNVTGNQTIRANFEINQYTVSYTVGTGGSVSPTSRLVDHGGTSAAVTPTATTGYTFFNFTVTSGAGNGTLNSSTGAVTSVTGAMTIQANFTLNSYTVSYIASTGGSVTVPSRTVSHGGDSAAPGHTANTGYHFVNFERTSGSGGTLNTSTGAVTNVTGNQTIRANFAINSYTVSYTAGTGGSVNPSSESVNWNSANNGTVANPSTGYSFTNYTLESGACNGTFSGATGVCSSVREAITVRANFTINSYTVNYQSNQGASFNPTFRTVTHGGSSTTPTITVDPGYTFSHYTAVSGVGNGDLNTSTGNVTNVIGNMTIEASFTLNEYTVSYVASTGGVVNTASRTVTHGGNSAAPGHSANAEYSFVNFEITSGSGNGTLNTSTGAVTNVIGHMTVRANFTINTYTVSYTASTGGSVNPSSESVNWSSANIGTSASPSTGYSFVNYTITSGTCSGTFNNSTGICSSVREIMTIRANFTINTYTVTYAGNGGTCIPTSRTVNYNTTSAAPSCSRTGYTASSFSRTSGSGGTLNTSTGEVTNVTGNQTITANWTINQYTVSYTASTGGSVNPSSESVNWNLANIGTSATPSTGYSFVNYTIESGTCNGTFSTSTGICSSVREAITIRANFTINTYTVSYTASTGGSVTVSSRTVSHGGTSDAPGHTADTGYHLVEFERTLGSGGSLNTSTGAVTNVTGNQTIRANFAINQYTISYTAGTGGSITPSSRTVSHGGTAAAPSATASTGYDLSHFSITVGGSNGILEIFTGEVLSVTGNLTVQANFSLKVYTITYNANSGTCNPGGEGVTHGNGSVGSSCSRSGYTLSGYTVSVGSCAGTFTPSTGICSNVQQDMTIRANWTINTYTVTYDGNGGTCVPSSRTVDYNTTSAAPACTRTSFEVGSFSRTSGSGGTLNTSTGAVTNVTGNQTISVSWIAAGPCQEIATVVFSGQTYNTIEIGNQCWFKQNLNYNIDNGVSSWCYNNTAANCTTYGRLYNLSRATRVCPTGWHTASEADWNTLIGSVGTDPGTKLKASAFGGTDNYGFSALGGGSGTSWAGITTAGRWWTGTRNGSDGYSKNMTSTTSTVTSSNTISSSARSVRCMKDYEPETDTYVTDPRDGKTYPVVQIGTQEWMAKNIDYNVGTGSACFDNDSYYCNMYGRLYILSKASAVCPLGWHTATKTDWDVLISYVGSNANAIKSPTFGGNNSTQFTALGGGGGSTPTQVGQYGRWWTGTQSGTDGIAKDMVETATTIVEGSRVAAAQYSVRCVKDIPPATTQTMTDSRDGQVYPTVQIGTQNWMAKNLNYNVSGGSCFNDDTALCAKFGRLYTFTAANSACPTGWHLPSDAEWTTLTNYLGANPGQKLKSPTFGGTNTSDFTAIGAGRGTYFTALGSHGYWWTSTSTGGGYAYNRWVTESGTTVSTSDTSTTSGAYSVRCVQN